MSSTSDWFPHFCYIWTLSYIFHEFSWRANFVEIFNNTYKNLQNILNIWIYISIWYCCKIRYFGRKKIYKSYILDWQIQNQCENTKHNYHAFYKTFVFAVQFFRQSRDEGSVRGSTQIKVLSKITEEPTRHLPNLSNTVTQTWVSIRIRIRIRIRNSWLIHGDSIGKVIDWHNSWHWFKTEKNKKTVTWTSPKTFLCPSPP